MVAWLSCVLCAASDKYLTIVGLYATEADWNIELLEQLLPTAAIVVHIVVSDDLLIKLEEMNPVHLILNLLRAANKFVCISRPHVWPLKGCLRSLGQMRFWTSSIGAHLLTWLRPIVALPCYWLLTLWLKAIAWMGTGWVRRSCMHVVLLLL